LETQSNVQDEEEHKKERNRNYKRESQTWLVVIDGNVKSMLLPRSRSTQSTSSVACHLIHNNKGRHGWFQWKFEVVFCN
jgi:hypothetical protein